MGSGWGQCFPWGPAAGWACHCPPSPPKKRLFLPSCQTRCYVASLNTLNLNKWSSKQLPSLRQGLSLGLLDDIPKIWTLKTGMSNLWLKTPSGCNQEGGGILTAFNWLVLCVGAAFIIWRHEILQREQKSLQKTKLQMSGGQEQIHALLTLYHGKPIPVTVFCQT